MDEGRSVGRAFAATVFSLLAACGGKQSATEPPPPVASGKQYVTSNITRADYAGSAECKDCHKKIYAKWQHSAMRNMTRLSAGATIREPFNGTVFHFRGDTVTLETIDGAPHMRIKVRNSIERLFKITKVIGGSHREDFVGVRMVPGDGGGPPHPFGGERIMPVSYVFTTKSLRYKGYSVQVTERTGIRVRAVWRKLCIFCHNTVPYLNTLYDDLGGRSGYQGSASTALPRRLRLRFVITDGDKLKRALGTELEVLGYPAKAALDVSVTRALTRAMRGTVRRFDTKHLIEVGIGCEYCHGGAKQHSDDPTLKPSFVPRSSFLRPLVGTPPRRLKRAEWINRTCARCHTVLFSRYKPTWEGGTISHNPGGSTINSGEGRNFLLGGCATAMACTTCHDPHAKDDPAARAKLATLAGNAVCTKCHKQYSGATALAAHTHHKATGDGSVCLNCHMVRKNIGLDYRLVRYHRIGSPTDKNRVERDRPVECAVCHDDKSVAELIGTMERWWNKRYDRTALSRLYGANLNVNVMAATLRRGKPHEQAVAVGVLGEHKRANRVAALAAQLTNRIVLVRFYAKAAIENITGKPLDVDLNKPVAEIRARAAELLHLQQ